MNKEYVARHALRRSCQTATNNQFLVGRLVREYREAAGLTQAALAAAVGVSRATLVSIETGRRVAGHQTMVRLARWLEQQ